jgi:hypothetical protein
VKVRARIALMIAMMQRAAAPATTAAAITNAAMTERKPLAVAAVEAALRGAVAG